MAGTGTADGSPEPADAASPQPGGQPAPGGRGPRYLALDALYLAHYRALVRLAALLTTDALMAEEIAADSVVALMSSAVRVRASEHTLFRLRQQVVMRSRAAGRPRSSRELPSDRAGPAGTLAAGGRPTADTGPAEDAGTVEDGRPAEDGRLTSARWQDSPVMQVLESLPRCQREAVVLRHYLGLGDREVAAIVGASRRAVRRRLGALSDAAYQALQPEGPDE
jgi:DNA-directed RNA polymerase specialized sigma24 family protein